MKKALSITLLLIATTIFNSVCLAQEKKVEWPERTAFHGVMSTTFHPSEEGNLVPIKTRSGEMVEKAEAWMKSTPPSEFNNKTVKKKLKQLYNESKALDKLVKNKGTDAEIKAALAKLHDRFHEIVEICHHKEGEKKHDH